MGLDNYPHNYPCKTQGTAVMVEHLDAQGKPFLNEDGTINMQIDCKATQECGGCPYKNDFEKSGLDGGAVYGMFGTDCWYRGKHGNALIAQIVTGSYDPYGADDDMSFYGNNEDASYRDAEGCNLLADYIDELLEDESENTGLTLAQEYGIEDELKYAGWYARWCAEKCDGMTAWY